MIGLILGTLLQHEISLGCGGSLASRIVSTIDDTHTQPYTCKMSYDLTLRKYSPLGFQAAAILPNGIGLTATLSILKIKGFHFKTFGGIFYNLRPINVQSYQRNKDWTVGLRIQQKLTKRLSFHIEQQQFLLDMRARERFQLFATPMYDESRKCGQTWAGISYSF